MRLLEVRRGTSKLCPNFPAVEGIFWSVSRGDYFGDRIVDPRIVDPRMVDPKES